MEHTGNTFDQVHVLRQQFMPNEPLRESFSQFIDKGPHGLLSISSFRSDERVIEMNEVGTPEVNLQKAIAEKAMALLFNTPLNIQGPIGGRVLKDNGSNEAVALQLTIRPVENSDTAKIFKVLDAMKVGRQTQAFGLLPRRLYVDVPLEQLTSFDDAKKGMNAINEALTGTEGRSLYQLTPYPTLISRTARRGSRDIPDVPRRVARTP